ncbi:FAD binding domain-containing protein [Cohnella laeviribosi]|uniref:FAD binding domain-containing protein n=1 Tax=Cohnella laeviribosi TaxID=380174 RepID=UPI0003700A34|nr:FAD binding domain-containing protein [Cohnella laeviribosi]
MIPYDFEYYRPASVAEAIRLYGGLEKQGKSPVYYSGGTEIITLGRINLVKTGAVIDIKHIPECQVLGFEQNRLILGAGLSLTKLEEADPFPLLSKTAREVADRTSRNKITLGGNICGRIFYREAVLPFLLADSQVVLAGRDGIKRRSVHDVCNGNLRLDKGELLVQLLTERSYLELPHVSIKKRKQWETGYPLITVAALRKDDRIRVAFSGLCPFPFRSVELEEELNRRHVPLKTRVDQAVRRLPSPILNDIEGSAEYRIFVLRNLLEDVMEEMEGK